LFQATDQFHMSLRLIVIQGNWRAFQHIAIPVEIAPDRYQSKPTGLLSLDPYPDGVLQPGDFVVQARRLFPGKLFFLDFDNMAYPEGRVNNQVANFELHETLHQTCY
jgi:hypothetical protein